MKYIITILLILLINLSAMTLKEVYDAALPNGDYDKVLNLEKGKVYKGGLFVGNFYNPITNTFDEVDDKSIKINGNGAILDLMNGQIRLAYTYQKLDIDSCVIMNGTLRYHGFPDPDDGHYILPYGNVKNITFYNAVDYGIRMEGAGENMDINKNLAVNCISTGGDFDQYHSSPSEIIRTGTSFSFSIFSWNGFPYINDNWSYNTLSQEDSLLHFSML